MSKTAKVETKVIVIPCPAGQEREFEAVKGWLMRVAAMRGVTLGRAAFDVLTLQYPLRGLTLIQEQLPIPIVEHPVERVSMMPFTTMTPLPVGDRVTA